MTNLIPARGDIEIVQKADYARHGFISFYGVDTTYLPDTVSVFIHTVDYETFDAKVYRMLGDWTENMAQNSLPPQQDYLDKVTGKEWIEIPNVPKSYLNYGFRFVPVYNVYGSTMHSIGVEGFEPYVTYGTYKPDISDFTVSGDLSEAICSWTQADCKKWKVDAILDGNVQATLSGESTPRCVFTNLLIKSGKYTFKLTCYYDDVETVETFEIYLAQKVPTITSLEPNNVQKLRTNPIDITFSGENITSWALSVTQNGVIKHSDSGTTGRTSIVQANVLSNGSATISLTVTYQGAGYTTTDTRTSTFTVYGKPSQPSFNVESSYNTPKPLFTWSNNYEQVAWKFIIETSTGTEVVNTGEQYGITSSYQPTISLTNGNYYVAKLQIKNQYDMWSDIVSGTFLVSFATLSQPVFTLYADEENAINVLVIESEENTSFSKHVVYRRKVGDIHWLKIADNVARVQTIEDCECGSNIAYEYKVSSVSDIDAHTDSEIKTITCKFHNTHISVANTNDKVILNMEVESDVSYTDDITFELYDGQDKPDSSSSGLAYAVLTVSAEVETEAYNKLMRYWKEPLLCLRDRSGLLLYGRITQPQVNFKCYGVYNVSFTFTECYNEEVDLNGTDEYRYCYFIECEW
nr:MAG TPA: hypothetical protein [Caudoviricetes sp.]